MVLGRELPCLVTVTGVKCSSNLRDATVFVSVFCPKGNTESQKASVLELLAKKRAAIQSMVASRIVLKYTPVLHFKLDDTAEKADRVETILRGMHFDEVPVKDIPTRNDLGGTPDKE